MMTALKIREIMDLYEKVLTERGHNKAQFHCLRIIPEMRLMLKDGQTEKACRLFGFIQGVLFSTGIFTAEELDHHCRTD